MNVRNVSDEKELAILETQNPELTSLLQIYPSELAGMLISNKDKLLKISPAAKPTSYFYYNYNFNK